jgi:hypothetical protein
MVRNMKLIHPSDYVASEPRRRQSDKFSAVKISSPTVICSCSSALRSRPGGLSHFRNASEIMYRSTHLAELHERVTIPSQGQHRLQEDTDTPMPRLEWDFNARSQCSNSQNPRPRRRGHSDRRIL